MNKTAIDMYVTASEAFKVCCDIITNKLELNEEQIDQFRDELFTFYTTTIMNEENTYYSEENQ